MREYLRRITQATIRYFCQNFNDQSSSVVCWPGIACPPRWLGVLFLPSPTKDKRLVQFSSNFTRKDGDPQHTMAAVLMEKAILSEAQLEGAILNEAQLEGAVLIKAKLEQAQLIAAQLKGADVSQAELQGASLLRAQLQGAHMWMAQLQGAILERTQLEGADFGGAHREGVHLIQAQLKGVNFRQAQLEGAILNEIILADEHGVGPRLVDAQWGNTNLTVVDWSQMSILGDEHEAQQKISDEEKKDKNARLHKYRIAVRSNRQLAVVLQAQGLNEDAARFAYRAQALQRNVSWLQMIQPKISVRKRIQALGIWFFSWFLFLLAGYGYKPGRSFLAYLMVIGTFTALYLLLNPYLAWYEAIVVSMTAFHGRGFSPSTFSPGDPLSIASAVEAFVGLIIEVTFIATLTRRFFGQ